MLYFIAQQKQISSVNAEKIAFLSNKTTKIDLRKIPAALGKYIYSRPTAPRLFHLRVRHFDSWKKKLQYSAHRRYKFSTVLELSKMVEMTAIAITFKLIGLV